MLICYKFSALKTLCIIPSYSIPMGTRVCTITWAEVASNGAIL